MNRLSTVFWQQIERDRGSQKQIPLDPEAKDNDADLDEWSRTVTVLVNNLLDKSCERELGECLHQFRLLVRKHAGSESAQNEINHLAARSLGILHCCAERIVGKKDRDALRKLFHVSSSLESFTEAAVPLIKQCHKLVPEEAWHGIRGVIGSGPDKSVASVDGLVDQLENVIRSSVTALEALPSPSVDSYGLSESFVGDLRKHFATEVLVPSDTVSRKDVITRSAPVVNGRAHPSGAGELVRTLMKAQYVQNEEVVVTVDELVPNVENLLLSGKSDEELQTELYDILGFANLDLISSLLANRLQAQRNRDAFSSNKVVFQSNRGGNFAAQVEIRRGGKQAQRKNQRNDENAQSYEGDGDGQWEQYPSMDYDGDLALQLQYKEVLSTHRAIAEEDPTYPFVFDQLAEVKRSAAFIQGHKIRLPDHEIKEAATYQMISVAAPSKSTIPIDRMPPLVRIADTDEILRNLFKGYDTLNQIQSVVYHAAYETSENMLVCAPTGAGKTNTAMLAIAREIRHHMASDGSLDKNFTIIYVAPMKALASEMVRTFTDRLKFYKLRVEEVTGDTQVAMFDLEKTQMIITTPEKWDVITRKSAGDTKLVAQVTLLIIDEIHLLNDERGPVIESLVARTVRLMEEQQKRVRFVGLSATLPTYVDVADFLHVNKKEGMFFFDGRFRPVPLAQTFIGMKSKSGPRDDSAMYQVMYERLMENIRHGHQVLIFVHARNQTYRVANTIRDMAVENGELDLFRPNENEDDYNNRNLVHSVVVKKMQDAAQRTTNRELKVLLPDGIGIHHAGMIRPDRGVVERLFKEGGIRALVCTATLAWGVNLPAHAVIIFGTKLYKPEKGSFEDIDVLDVQQIFGRAGRPQYDTSGHGIIITTLESLPKFIAMLTSSQDIESNMPDHMLEHLNAEIVLHNISSVAEAVEWLKSTYWYRRVIKNPLLYGLDRKMLHEDLHGYLRSWFEKKVHVAGRELDKARMVRYHELNGTFSPTQFGNIASWYYIDVQTMQVFADPDTGLRDNMQEYEILGLVCKSSEFSQIKVRNEEMDELDEWKREYAQLPTAEGLESSQSKVNILLQSYISRCQPKAHSLSSDLYYCQQNAARIIRAIFQMAMYKAWSSLADRALNLCLWVEHRLWMWDHALKQLGADLPPTVYQHLESKDMGIDRLKELDEGEIGMLVHNRSIGKRIKEYADMYPNLDVEASAKPIGNSIIQINLKITPKFIWNDKYTGSKRVLNFWIWAEDPNNGVTYHTQEYALQKNKVLKKEVDEVDFIIPFHGAHMIQIHIRSDRFLHCNQLLQVHQRGLKIPKFSGIKTELLKLAPLATTVLHDPVLESLFTFDHFNPIQSQVFHTLMHTDHNVLLGAPTGSGKTIVAEFAIFRALKITKCKVVYIAPLKALVRERVADWKERLENRVGWKVVELTGDTSPDIRAINAAQIIITTPEKWDGISRSWQHRGYVQDVKLLIFDEIHMLGEDRGPVIEVIVSRTNFIASFTKEKVRIVGLSTALASADDVASWLDIRPAGLFNFGSAVRPVPLVQHISGYPGKHYCPRMALMNKPAYQAIREYSGGKPVLVFVSSRRQTRLTGFALLSFASLEMDRRGDWMNMSQEELAQVLLSVRDPELKQLLNYGIGIHHAGLHDRDRVTVEHLFLNGKILVLVATATLAWGVNFPAHLVVIKGTEFYDGKMKQYVKMPLTDVLQMAGRAGRPQFDNEGVAVILCHEPLKNYYSKFLHNPLPVESQLNDVLADHINAEIVAGTLTTFERAMEYMTWTYFYRRLLANPDYYSVVRPSAVEDPEKAAAVGEDDEVLVQDVVKHLRQLIYDVIMKLHASGCVDYYRSEARIKSSVFSKSNVDQIPNFVIMPTSLGTIASYYYLKHGTMRILSERLTSTVKLSDVLQILTEVEEFDQMPVRHNEDAENGLLSKQVPIPVETSRLDNPHAKVLLLLQVYFSRNQIQMPNADYATDLKTVMDQVMRVLQAMIDVAAQKGLLGTTLRVMQLSQMMVQGEWIGVDSFYTLPHADILLVQALRRFAKNLPDLVCFVASSGQNLIRLRQTLSCLFPNGKGTETKIIEAINSFPIIQVSLRISRNVEEGSEEEQSRASTTRIPGRKTWISIECGASYTLEVRCVRIRQRWMSGKRAVTSRFSKPKDENWWLVVGEVETSELWMMKRVGFISQSLTTSMIFSAPTEACTKILHFYLISDSYLGMDQQVPIYLDVVTQLTL